MELPKAQDEDFQLPASVPYSDAGLSEIGVSIAGVPEISPEEKRRLALEKEKAAIAAKKEITPDKMFKDPDVKKTMARYLTTAVNKGKKDKSEESSQKPQIPSSIEGGDTFDFQKEFETAKATASDFAHSVQNDPKNAREKRKRKK